MTRIWGIDPSPSKVPFVLVHAFDEHDQAPNIILHGEPENVDEWEYLFEQHAQMGDVVVCEMVASYGLTAGASLFETCVTIGRLMHLVRDVIGGDMLRVTRQQAKLCLCGRSAGKDANVRAAVLERYPATGGGANPVLGTKAQPGALYGIKGDLYAALAVAIAYNEGATVFDYEALDTKRRKKQEAKRVKREEQSRADEQTRGYMQSIAEHGREGAPF